MSSSLKNLLNQSNYIYLNKILIKNIGLYETIILGEFINAYEYYSINNQLEDDAFYYSYDKLEKEFNIKKFIAKKSIDKLSDLKIIKVVKKGIPCKNYYTINDKVLASFLILENKKSNFRKQEIQNQKTSNPKIEDKSENFSKQVVQNQTANNEYKYNEYNNNEYNNNEKEKNIKKETPISNENNSDSLFKDKFDNSLEFIEDEELRKLFKIWVDYKKTEMKETYKTNQSFLITMNKALKDVNNNKKLLGEAIETSIARRWKGIIITDEMKRRIERETFDF